MSKPSLTPLQWVAVGLLAGPPLVLVLCYIGPGRWMNVGQDTVFGGHSLRLSVLAVLLLEFVLIWTVASAVRRLTGRTLVELFTKREAGD